MTPDQTKIARQIQQAAATKCIYTRHVREHMQSDDPKRAYSEDNLRQALIKGKVFFWHKESNSPLFGFGSLRVAAALSDGKYPKAVVKTAFIQLS